jgi:hypothetical protein
MMTASDALQPLATFATGSATGIIRDEQRNTVDGDAGIVNPGQ